MIRQAVPYEASAIARVQVESWRSTYGGIVPAEYLASLNIETQTAMWSAQLAENGPLILVAEDESGVFGFASGGVIREALDDFDAELYVIYLLPRQQRKGAGRALCQRIAANLRDQGFKSMIVWALADNPFIAFYQRLGGVQVAHKLTEFGGVTLPDLAFGWRSWDSLL
ncbi:GNAT family N-acetyltransferase [Granulicella arctica]|uniref:GNAT family N-acetyltransferase n=1 Tax=Granulicella arctica TaxID=940613 RepID=UPI0021DF921D|nr:GNAT family N-acetyltransferase [Granulicella arctica]